MIWPTRRVCRTPDLIFLKNELAFLLALSLLLAAAAAVREAVADKANVISILSDDLG